MGLFIPYPTEDKSSRGHLDPLPRNERFNMI